MDNLVIVSKERFFAYINPRDIVLRTEREATYWETRDRRVVGKSTPGYMGGGEKTYALARSLVTEA